MMYLMSCPALRRAKSRLIVPWLIALSLIGPVLVGSSISNADELKNDARLEGYRNSMGLDSGTAPYFILMGVLGVMGMSVMLKDAKRAHTTKQ